MHDTNADHDFDEWQQPHGKKRPVNFKNFWPTYFCTDNSGNFTVESPVSFSCIQQKTETVYHLYKPF